MSINVHVHSRGGEKADDILRAMDDLGLERIVIFSASPRGPIEAPAEGSPDRQREVIDEVARLVARNPARLIGFAFIEPTLPHAPEAADYALGEKGLHGIKMTPNHWYPDDERAQAVYSVIEKHRKPALFHSGVLALWGNTSRYCRPCDFEIMMEYPGIHFALAHMGWPWTDECIAVAGKMKWVQPRRGHEWTCWLDITTGAPRPWKTDALRKALDYLGDEHLLFGSDGHLPAMADLARLRLQEDREMLAAAGASEETIERVFRTNALEWLGLK
jgi:predicted TIM-barrel fold metal-dependent hydrolase